MGDFASKLRLKGLAEEDVYFAKRDRELLEALRKKKLAKEVTCDSDGEKESARPLPSEIESVAAGIKDDELREIVIRAARANVKE